MISKIVGGITPSATCELEGLIGSMKKEGIDVVALNIGEPDYKTPENICQACKDAIDARKTTYVATAGVPELRQAICRKLQRDNGLVYAPEQICVSTGAKQALFNAVMAVTNPGDEVIIPTPDFSLYESIVELNDGVKVMLPTAHNRFQIDPKELAAAITDKTKAIILTSPNNPSGCIYTKETLDAIHDVLKDKPIFVICDDVYRTLTYTGNYHSFAEYQDMRDRIIVVQSFSKPYAMTGWRLGYVMCDAPIRDRMQIYHQYCVTSIPSFVQRACVAALESDTSEFVEIFRKRKEYVYKRLTDMGLEVQEPEGAFYMFINIQKFGMDSEAFCEKMLKEGLVGLIPGIYFSCEGYMRLSYCYSDADLKEGLDRIEKFIKTL